MGQVTDGARGGGGEHYVNKGVMLTGNDGYSWRLYARIPVAHALDKHARPALLSHTRPFNQVNNK